MGFHALIFSLQVTFGIIYVVAKAAFLGWVLPFIHNLFYCFYFFAISIIFLDRLNNLRKVMTFCLWIYGPQNPKNYVKFFVVPVVFCFCQGLFLEHEVADCTKGSGLFPAIQRFVLVEKVPLVCITKKMIMETPEYHELSALRFARFGAGMDFGSPLQFLEYNINNFSIIEEVNSLRDYTYGPGIHALARGSFAEQSLCPHQLLSNYYTPMADLTFGGKPCNLKVILSDPD